MRAAAGIRTFLQSHEREFDVVEATNWLGHGAFITQMKIPLITRISTPSMESLENTWGVRQLNWRGPFVPSSEAPHWPFPRNYYVSGEALRLWQRSEYGYTSWYSGSK
jgi:hypothetical protein